MVNPWHLLVILFASAIAFAASITYALVLDADGMPSQGVVAQAQGPQDRTNCDEIYGTAYRSEAERSWFDQNCSVWSKSIGDIPEPFAAPQAPAPKTPPPEGRDCNQIRGTAYRSNSERDWYLANCLANQNQAIQGQPPAAGDRTDCNQIRGTPYNSDAERLWYIANCSGQQPQAATGPDRTDCNEIRGSAYRSDSERRWYQENCSRR